MKYLIINDKFESGGAEIYARNLKNLFSKRGEQCALLTFDSIYDFSELPEDEYFNIPISTTERCISKVAIHRGLAQKIDQVLTSFAPDLVIVNNLFDVKFSLLHALKLHKAIRIMHDYSPVCIYSGAVCDDGSLCTVGYKAGKCNINCSRKGKLSNQLKIWNYKRVERISKKCFSMFIAPSNDLTLKLQYYGYNAHCLNNFLSVNDSTFPQKHFIADSAERIYLYVGKINYYKGIMDFIPYWNEFHKQFGGNLWIAGAVESDADQKKLFDYAKQDHINYLGCLSHPQIIDLMNQAYCILVPSRWAENYPTVILEAMLSGSLVIGSARGGIPEMLDEKRGLLFDWEQPQTITDALLTSAYMDTSDYTTYSQNAYQYVAAHTQDAYMNCLFDMLKNIL